MNKNSSVTIQSDVDLSSFNTLGVSASASAFVDVTHRDQLVDLYENGFFEEEPPFILGGGSNILILKNPVRPVLKISIKGIEIIENKDNTIRVKVGAGEDWHQFVTWAVENDYGGIENLALIPGTVGAAPIQNIGAYGVELEQVFESLELFDLDEGTFKSFSNKQCRFGYRDSIFKHELRSKIIVTNVVLNLTSSNHAINDSYNSLQSYLKEHNVENPTIKDICEAVTAIRRSKLPDPDLIGNAGSFFKNPVIDSKQFDLLKFKYQDIPFYQVDENSIKIPAAWLIEKAGWKGKREGDVGTYENQALVIVNHGSATGREIFQFSKKIQESVRKKFGIELVPEVNIID